ncbi:putative extracellular nuclease [Lysinibacillus composti]|uniref:Endonuclease/exonuclease/phosphatase n=1 Tax=Lysinibacillus composti TaxID=720633 RepID=A0A3N9UHE4_9BACI|nr:DUF6359 domain-containing protein [Lysinibacillus composti]MBM7609089.1 putative extracellular nuclease [Lysinibacillus composti]RQW75491.1 endonuclease/exonuclease/phosphatase [Lysinibacillus composti]
MSKRSNKKYFNAFLATSLVASAVAPVMPFSVSAETIDSVTTESVSYISVADAIANNTGNAKVKGYIVGYVKSKTNVIKTGFPDDNNFAIADSMNETDTSKMLFVQVTSGYRSDFGLKSNPDLIGQQVEITGNLESYFSSPGLKSPSAMSLSGDNQGNPEKPEHSEETEVISIANAHTKAMGETVTVKGIVAANLKNTISIQDETGGIAVRPASLDMKVGDEVTLTGKLADYRGLLQLDSASIVEKGPNVGAPQVKVVTGAEVSEENESQLVTVKNVTLNSVTGTTWKNFTASDGSEFIVRDETGELTSLEVGTTYESITGIVQQFENDYQIIPRSELDIVVDSTAIKPALASLGSGTFVGSQSVTLSTTTAGAEIFYTLDGSEPTDQSAKYVEPIQITKNTTLKAIVKAQDGTFSEVSTFDYKITDSLQIHDLQGEGHTSPYDDQTVQGIQGIVTYNFTLNGSNYYTIQTPDELADNNVKTSEAILLYSGKNPWDIQVGDLVSVTGTVDEYAYDGYSNRNNTDMKTTQINVRDDKGGKVEVLQENVDLPEPFVIDESTLTAKHIEDDELTEFQPEEDALDFWESIEGMRVEVGSVKAVAPQEHGDLITVLESAETNSLHGGLLLTEDDQNPERIQFRLEPNGPARDLEVATGDKFEGPITGIVGYSYQNYKIYADLDKMENAYVKGSAVPEKTNIVKADNKLTIASYNLENFSNNSASDETPDSKVKKLARAIGTDMGSPDIVGVTEVQDNNGQDAGGTAANESYERLIAAIKAESGVEYKYLNIDPIAGQDGGAPNANIRVGFLYNPERVTLPDGIESGDATTAVGYENGKLTHNPGRIDPTNAAFNSSRKPLAAQFNFQGEEVIVIANHWNSKSGDTPLFGATQPPVYGSEEQRHKIANVVYDFIEDIKTKNPNANIVSLGDFNDFQYSKSLEIHEGELMTNMINTVDEKDRYTYLFQGNSQVLDHILVSNNLVDNTKIDILHINADFTDMAGRASDHDPVMVQIDLKAKDEVDPVEPIQAEQVYNLTNYKTGKLIINKPSVSVKLDKSSVIKNGIVFTGEYAEFEGEGLAKVTLTIQPKQPGAIIDLKGSNVGKIIIDGPNVKEIRGLTAEKKENIEYINGANAENINFPS